MGQHDLSIMILSSIYILRHIQSLETTAMPKDNTADLTSSTSTIDKQAVILLPVLHAHDRLADQHSTMIDAS